jgi:hypothetical protein
MSTEKVIPKYHTPSGTYCPECGELCRIVPLLNDYAYSGTHCTHGLDGNYYPDNWGEPVSDCCHIPIEGYYGDDYE